MPAATPVSPYQYSEAAYSHEEYAGVQAFTLHKMTIADHIQFDEATLFVERDHLAFSLRNTGGFHSSMPIRVNVEDIKEITCKPTRFRIVVPIDVVRGYFRIEHGFTEDFTTLASATAGNTLITFEARPPTEQEGSAIRAAVKPAFTREKERRASMVREMSVSTLTFVAATGEVYESPVGSEASVISSTNGLAAGVAHYIDHNWGPHADDVYPAVPRQQHDAARGMSEVRAEEDSDDRDDTPKDASDVGGGDDNDDVRSVSQNVPIVRSTRKPTAASTAVSPVKTSAKSMAREQSVLASQDPDFRLPRRSRHEHQASPRDPVQPPPAPRAAATTNLPPEHDSPHETSPDSNDDVLRHIQARARNSGGADSTAAKAQLARCMSTASAAARSQPAAAGAPSVPSTTSATKSRASLAGSITRPSKGSARTSARRSATRTLDDLFVAAGFGDDAPVTVTQPSAIRSSPARSSKKSRASRSGASEAATSAKKRRAPRASKENQAAPTPSSNTPSVASAASAASAATARGSRSPLADLPLDPSEFDIPRARRGDSQETTETFVATPPEYRRAPARNQPQKQQRPSGDVARLSTRGPPTTPVSPSAALDRSPRADAKAMKAAVPHQPRAAAAPAGRSPLQGTTPSATTGQSPTFAARAASYEPLLEALAPEDPVAAMLLQRLRLQQQETASTAREATKRTLKAVKRVMVEQRATYQARITSMRASALRFIEEIDAVSQADDASIDDVLRGVFQQLFDDTNNA